MTVQAPDSDAGLSLGIQENLTQFVHQLIQVLLVGFALGTETLGSIVTPATRCGVAGLRPTYGRVSRAGAMV